MIKTFKVAEHHFSLEMPDGFVLWEELSQYQPFEVSEASEKVFSLKLVREMPEGRGRILFDAPTEDGQTVVRLYEYGEGYMFEMTPDKSLPIVARVCCSKDYSEATLHVDSRRKSDFLFSINNAMMLLYAFTTARYGTLEMHASVILNGGRTYLFLGKSGTGKSTHSSLWLKYIEGSELLNDDNPVVRVWPDGRIITYGSPWSGKTPCYRNIEAPTGAFVRIRQCPENKIERMGVLESYAAIYSSCSGFKFDHKMADDLHNSMSAIVTTIPCYILDCRPDREAAELSAATVR